MNHFSTSILTLCLIMIMASGFAQVSVGIRGGITSASIPVKSYGGEIENTLNPTFSIPVEIRLSTMAVIQPELSFSQKGARITQKTSSITTSGEKTNSFMNCRYKLNYAHMPVLLKLSPIHKKVNFSVFMGPNLGVAISGTEETLYETATSEGAWANVESRKVDIGGNSSEFDRVEVGMIFGGGIQYQLNRSKLVLDVRHQVGLGHDAHPGNEGNISNQGTSISFGYMFELR